MGDATATATEKPETPPPPEEEVFLGYSNQELHEKIARTQESFASGIGDRLPDGGAKLKRMLRELEDEFHRRKNVQLISIRTSQIEDGVECERLIQSRCAGPSGLARNCANGTLTKADFKHAFGACSNQKVEAKAGDASSLGMGIVTQDEADCSVKNEQNRHEQTEALKPCPQPVRTTHTEVSSQCVGSFVKKEGILSTVDSLDAGPSNITQMDHPNDCTKRKRTPTVGMSMRLRSKKVQEVVLLDEEVQHLQPTEEAACNAWNMTKIYYPSREHPDSVELSREDLKCLEPESYLSSPIMNFYIMYLQRPLSASRPTNEYYFFNTFFFSKLEEAMSPKGDRSAGFLKLRRWWKGVNIFQKAYIFLPVHADTHWSLVIICIPAEEAESGPVILHLDSLKFHSSRLIFSVVEKFLKEEWNYLNQNGPIPALPIPQRVWKNLPRRIERKTITVPQQDNEYDCGLFVLYFMERFIDEAPERLRKKDLPSFGKKWFRSGEASALRKQIRTLLLEMFESNKTKNSKKETTSSEYSTEGG